MPIESLDTAISIKDANKVNKILTELGFSKRTQQFSHSHKAYFKIIIHNNEISKINFDIQVGGVHWNDMRYLDEKIFSQRIKIRTFYTLNNEDACVMYIAHSILGKRMFKEKYKQIIQSFQGDKKSVKKCVSRIFGRKYAKLIFENIRINNFDGIPFYKLITLFLLRKPSRIKTLSFLALRWFHQKKNPLRLAPLISIVGPDGAGKSTMVKNLKEFLEKTGRESTIIYSGRGRGNFLPIASIGRKYKRREKKNDKLKKIKKANVKRKLLYCAMAPIYTLDLLLRYFIYMLPERIKGTYVITDRYGTDIILMKNVPFNYKKILYLLFPKPTTTIYLYNKAEVLHQRRPEETIEELNRQMAIFAKCKDLSENRIKSDDKGTTKNLSLQKVQQDLLIRWD